MAHAKASVFILMSIILVVLSASLEHKDCNKESESKIKPDEILPSIVTKIVERGLVPKRSDSTKSTVDDVEPPSPTLTQQQETIQKTVSTKRSDDNKLPHQLQCAASNEGHSNMTEALITYDEFKCNNNNNKSGEYLHDVELIDGTRHKEEGLVVDGYFNIRGFFFSANDPKFYHLYINDKKGFHYFQIPVMGDGTQEYGIGDDDEEICSVTGSSCIAPNLVASMLG